MLIEFLNFLNINNSNKINHNKTIEERKHNEEIEIMDEEQTYKIMETEVKKNNNKIIKQITKIIPIGNGKAIKKIQTQCINRI